MTDNNLSTSEWCLGCPYPIYDDRRGEWDWYCRQHSPTGIKCSNVAVLRERCTFFTRSRGLDNLAGMTPLHEVCQSDGRACPLGVTCPIRDRVLGRRSREQTCREE